MYAGRVEDVSVETRRKALEQIRYADRLVGGALGTFQGLRRRNALDVLGVNIHGGDGYFGEHDRRENTSAIHDVAEAEGAFRKALELLGYDLKTKGAEGFVEFRSMEGAATRVFDILQLMRAQENLSRAEELHQSFVRVFEAVRASDPGLADVPPLADWDDSPVDAARVALKYNPGVRLYVGIIVVVLVASAGYSILAWALGWDA